MVVNLSKMIILKKQSLLELGFDVYVEMYKGVFGKWDNEGNCPADVYSGYDNDEYVGFIAGYATAPGCWYLQRAGFIQDKQKQGCNLKKYKDALSILHKEWVYIRTHVNNADLPALKMDLNAGFKIIGVRHISGQTEVEMLSLGEG